MCPKSRGGPRESKSFAGSPEDLSGPPPATPLRFPSAKLICAVLRDGENDGDLGAAHTHIHTRVTASSRLPVIRATAGTTPLACSIGFGRTRHGASLYAIYSVYIIYRIFANASTMIPSSPSSAPSPSHRLLDLYRTCRYSYFFARFNGLRGSEGPPSLPLSLSPLFRRSREFFALKRFVAIINLHL